MGVEVEGLLATLGSWSWSCLMMPLVSVSFLSSLKRTWGRHFVRTLVVATLASSSGRNELVFVLGVALGFNSR